MSNERTQKPVHRAQRLAKIRRIAAARATAAEVAAADKSAGLAGVVGQLLRKEKRHG